MLRKSIIIASLVLMGTGCASRNSPQAASVLIDYRAPVATALLFDLPQSAQATALLDLSREPRQPGAFVGFEEQTASFHYLQVDDHQGGFGRDRYDRHDYIDQVGVSYR